MSSRIIIIGVIGVIAILGLGIGGFFLFVEVEEIHKQNTEELADFGNKVVPRKFLDESDGATYGLIDGNMQLPPSIQQKKLSSTEKVILSLSRDKDQLQIEVAEIKERLEQQQGRLQELRAYKAENERFAPEQLNQERLNAVELLKNQLDNIPDLGRFNDFQRKAMLLATANLYTDIIRQHQLSMDDKSTAELLDLLPQFSICLGEGLPYISNNRREESAILKALSAGDQTLITGRLADDFKVIYDPCLKQLNRQLNQLMIQQQHRKLDSDASADSDSLIPASAAQSSQPSVRAIDPSLSLTEQLIQGLSYDKERVLNEAERLKQQFARQAEEIAALKRYQDTTDRFAPLPTLEERNRAQKRLLAYLEESDDARRFNNFEKQAMSLAAANHYAGFSTRQRLVLTETTKEQIIQNHLPRFSFCYGDGLKFIIDNHQQERQLINALREQDTEYMDAPLAQKIAAIAKPCEEQLDRIFSGFY